MKEGQVVKVIRNGRCIIKGRITKIHERSTVLIKIRPRGTKTEINVLKKEVRVTSLNPRPASLTESIMAEHREVFNSDYPKNVRRQNRIRNRMAKLSRRKNRE